MLDHPQEVVDLTDGWAPDASSKTEIEEKCAEWLRKTFYICKQSYHLPPAHRLTAISVGLKRIVSECKEEHPSWPGDSLRCVCHKVPKVWRKIDTMLEGRFGLGVSLPTGTESAKAACSVELSQEAQELQSSFTHKTLMSQVMTLRDPDITPDRMGEVAQYLEHLVKQPSNALSLDVREVDSQILTAGIPATAFAEAINIAGRALAAAAPPPSVADPQPTLVSGDSSLPNSKRARLAEHTTKVKPPQAKNDCHSDVSVNGQRGIMKLERCEKEGCTKRPAYVLLGERVARFCNEHSKHMERAKIFSKLCKHEECQNAATYGIRRGMIEWCETHACGKKGVRLFRCPVLSGGGVDAGGEPCLKPTVFANVGEGPTRCTEHREKGMVNPLAFYIRNFSNVVWPALQLKGWTLVVGNRPKDFYYMPPGVTRLPPMRVRQDYFDSKIQVIEYCLSTEEHCKWMVKEHSKASSPSVGDQTEPGEAKHPPSASAASGGHQPLQSEAGHPPPVSTASTAHQPPQREAGIPPTPSTASSGHQPPQSHDEEPQTASIGHPPPTSTASGGHKSPRGEAGHPPPTFVASVGYQSSQSNAGQAPLQSDKGDGNVAGKSAWV
ncbi:unnamed protein product [Choristocarpus tenellus]